MAAKQKKPTSAQTKARHDRDKEDSGHYEARFKAKIANIPKMPVTGVDFTKLSMTEVLGRLTGNIAYDPKYAYYLIEHCHMGRSIITFPASYCLAFSQVEAWKEHKEFREAVLLAVSYELMFWEHQLETSTDREAIAKAKLRLEQITARLKAEDMHRTFREVPEKDQNPENAFSLGRTRDLGEGSEIFDEEEFDDAETDYQGE